MMLCAVHLGVQPTHKGHSGVSEGASFCVLCPPVKTINRFDGEQRSVQFYTLKGRKGGKEF